MYEIGIYIHIFVLLKHLMCCFKRVKNVRCEVCLTHMYRLKLQIFPYTFNYFKMYFKIYIAISNNNKTIKYTILASVICNHELNISCGVQTNLSLNCDFVCYMSLRRK